MPKYYPGERGVTLKTVWYEKTGEYREPRKGEFYLSGAFPCAYLAPNDLSAKFHIAVVVVGPRKRILMGGFWYVLDTNQKRD